TLLGRLAALHATVRLAPERVELVAPGRVVSSLSPAHADLVVQMGGAERVELRATLQFPRGEYTGGQEAYYLVKSGGGRTRGRSAVLVRLNADVRRRTSPQASPHTLRERR